MWRSQTLLSARRLFEHQVQTPGPASAATGRRDVPAHHLLLKAAPAPLLLCRARASAQPKKAQHDNHDDNHTNNPKDIVHSCLPSFAKWSRLTNSSSMPFRLTPRRIIEHAARSRTLQSSPFARRTNPNQ